jgi:hypothetical protein
MLRVILDEGLFEKDFVEKWTSAFQSSETFCSNTHWIRSRNHMIEKDQILQASRLFRRPTRPAFNGAMPLA